MIKAIETRYKGFRFRSRLEARWAVFFDALNLDWTYEPEGYHLHSGEMYLPDFFIRDLGIFVEVKGGYPTETEFANCMWLADQTGNATLLVNGLPLENPGHLFCWDMTDGSGGSYQSSATIVWPYDTAARVITHSDDRVDRDRDLFLKFFAENHIEASFAPFYAMKHSQAFAADLAKSARFEHGESGATS